MTREELMEHAGREVDAVLGNRKNRLMNVIEQAYAEGRRSAEREQQGHPFVEVMAQFDKMCNHYQRIRQCPLGCPMNGCNISQCRKVAFEEPEQTERAVIQWAKTNREPKIPSWAEWLQEQGVVKDSGEYFDLPEFRAPIPADIAQKLGIAPKVPKEE